MNTTLLKEMITNNYSPFPNYKKFLFYLIDKNDNRINEIDIINNKLMELDFNKIKEKQDMFNILGLFGMGGKIYVDLETGIFHLDGNQTLVFGIQYDGKAVCFENTSEEKEFDFHDMIQLKKAFTDFSPNPINDGTKPRQTQLFISEHLIGYKLKIDIDDEQYLECEIIFILPVNSGSYKIGFNITPKIKEDTKEIYIMTKRNNSISAQKVKICNNKYSKFEMII